MDSPVRPYPVDFWSERDQIMMAISKAFAPRGDLDGLREEILKILCRSAEKSISQFHDGFVKIEKKIAAFDAEENPAEPPFRHLLKRFMIHVNCCMEAELFVMVMSPSDADLTPEEQGMLLALVREILLENRFEERMEAKR